jgi:hypothetical protein
MVIPIKEKIVNTTVSTTGSVLKKTTNMMNTRRAIYGIELHKNIKVHSGPK